MKNFFKTLQKDSLLVWSFWITIFAILILCISIGLLYSSLPPFIPLYNHLPWGYERLGQTYEIFIPVFILIFLFIVNTILGMRLMAKSPLLARFLFFTTICLSFFTCIFIGKLIFIAL